MEIKPESRQRVLFLAAAFVVTAKLLLTAGRPLTAIPGSVHDDHLFLRLAQNILETGWLGDYDVFTLIKGPVYPIFIAANFLIGLPLLLSQELLYLLAVVAVVVAVSGWVRSRFVLWLILALLCFNPGSYAGVTSRVLRLGIHPALVLLVVAGALGVLSGAWAGRRVSLGWSILLGLALGLFWLNREEGIWLLPWILIVLAVSAWRVTRRAGGLSWRDLAVVVLPVGLWLGAMGVVATMNRIHYGVFTTLEIKSGSFKRAYGALSRVRPAEEKPYVPVARDTRQRVYRASPAFAELARFFEREGFWDFGCPAGSTVMEQMYPETCGEIAGGWFQWALRDAADRAGYHLDARSAAAYYERLNEEIDEACAAGALDCRRDRETLVPPLRWEHFRRLAGVFPVALWQTASFGSRSVFHGKLRWFVKYSVPATRSVGSIQQLALFQDLTHNRLMKAEEPLVHAVGWACRRGQGVLGVQLYADGHPVPSTLEYRMSPGLVQYCSSDPQRDKDPHARFSIVGVCPAPCSLVFFDSQGPVAEYSMDPAERGWRPGHQRIGEALVTVAGWACRFAGGPVRVKLSTGGNSALSTLEYLPSPGLVETCGAEASRFTIAGECPAPCSLVFFDSGGTLGEIPIANGRVQWAQFRGYDQELRFHIEEVVLGSDDTLRLNVESIDLAAPVPGHGEAELRARKVAILERIATVFQKVTPWLAAVGVATFLLSLTRSLHRRRMSALLLMNTVLLGSVLTLTLLLSLVEVTSFPAVSTMYLAPGWPLLLLFVVLAPYELWLEWNPSHGTSTT